MTEEAKSYALTSSGAGDVASCVERLVQETSEDLRKCRVEQSQLRSQITEVINENQHLTGELGKYKQTMSNEDLKQRLLLTSDALANAISQIDVLQKERRSFQAMQGCAQRTIKNMETELQTYRSQMPLDSHEQMTEKHNKIVKMLEAKLTKQQEAMRSQSDLIRSLHENKKRYADQIEQLQAKLKARYAAAHEDSESKITYLQQQLKESIKREMEAMRKVQESLGISEAAVLEKEGAEKRAAAYKEETKTLAVNIGSIMEEAVKRVDNEVAQLRDKLTEKDKTIASLRDKLKTEAVDHKTTTQTLESRYNCLKSKYKETLKQNEKLEMHVEDCKKRLMELEQCAYNDEANSLKIKKDYETQMENYLHKYKDLKAHYKDVLDDLTTKFECAYENVNKEKCELQAENEMLRSAGVEGDGTDKCI
ncbi:kinectin [Drosophila grimshawi]|uniref:GH17083 n=1 Tax=Drosophila grimshawi TaxID=7222 RepID=B4JU91_DROGR|nr:kinectin [Drosophila grimshawi]EDV91061.1 GH17083 [Drosophila grimshawi]